MTGELRELRHLRLVVEAVATEPLPTDAVRVALDTIESLAQTARLALENENEGALREQVDLIGGIVDALRALGAAW